MPRNENAITTFHVNVKHKKKTNKTQVIPAIKIYSGNIHHPDVIF